MKMVPPPYSFRLVFINLGLIESNHQFINIQGLLVALPLHPHHPINKIVLGIHQDDEQHCAGAMHFSSESLLSMSQSEYMLLRNDSG